MNGLVEIMEFARGNNFGEHGSNISDARNVSKQLGERKKKSESKIFVFKVFKRVELDT